MSKKNILIIDENPEFTKSLKVLLLDVFGTNELMVKHVNNILDGLELLENTPFHFIFIRENMMGENNIELKTRIKKVSENKLVEIIVLSFNSISDWKLKPTNLKDTCNTTDEEIDAYNLTSIIKRLW